MSNPFKDIFSNFNIGGAGASDTAVGIDIGSSAIKVVEIKKKGGKAMLETYGSISLGPYAEGGEAGRVTNLTRDKIIEALKEVLKQAGVSSTSSALAIPVQSSLIFTIELPLQVKENEMTSVVSTEARKYIPVPITEVSLDYFVLPKKELSYEEANTPELSAPSNDKMEVLVVAIQNDAISNLRSVVSETHITADFFEVEIFSSIRACFEHELSLVLLIDFGASRTKISLVEFGMVKGFHTINRGGADISDSISKSFSIPFAKAEEMKKEFGLYGNPAEKELADIIKTHVDYIFGETNNVLLGYEKKYNRAISKVILTGGGCLLKGLTEVATSNFRAEIEVGHPFAKVGAPAFLSKVLDTTGPEFAVAIGLALRKLQ
ncbi:MAG: type IV pilus assembly protein PilM [Candidatus Pacebacteria bacterium]|nr:type IV pilus assembly protein PilM [Candidatus Paceibacterota bacterium]